jgi:beta-lactamase class A
LALIFGFAVVACGGSAESKPPEVLVAGLPTRPVVTPSPTPVVVAAAVQTPEPTPPPRPPMVVSLAWLDGAPAVPDLPSPFAGPATDAGLKAAIEGALAGREGSYSVVVHNLANGRYAELNADQVYYAASLYKLEVLL